MSIDFRTFEHEYDTPQHVKSLRLISDMAMFDEINRSLTYPFSIPSAEEIHYLDSFEAAVKSAPTVDLHIFSFDIDLTLMIPEDELNIKGLIPIDILIKLQLLGNVVGTCSDREPSDQWRTMLGLSFIPDFCIPKEMLGMLGQLLPGAKLLHIGDDLKRDKEIALKYGWEYADPSDFLGRNLA